TSRTMSKASPWAASRPRKTLPESCPSSPPTTPTTSPVRPCWSTAACSTTDRSPTSKGCSPHGDQAHQTQSERRGEVPRAIPILPGRHPTVRARAPRHHPPIAQPSLGQRTPDPSTSMGDMSKRIVIIGAGLAGTTAARELNERGQAVTVIDPQAVDTCERPPLSKLLFDNSRHHLLYHLESTKHITFVRDWAEQLTLAEAAAEARYSAESKLHPQRLTDDHATLGTVRLAAGESIYFTHCIRATGMEV